jgi:hypothetical protein
MTNLNPTPGWDDVPQLEITTPAIGGPGGPMNLQAQALLNRTEAIAEGDFTDAGTLQSSDISLLTRGTGLLKTTLGAIGAWIIETYNGFVQAGTGAVAMTMKAKAQQIVHASDYGVKCDGTNETAALNLALNFCNTKVNGRYKKLVMPPGVCVVTPGGLVDVLCSIDGPQTTLQASSNAAANLLTIGYDPTLANKQEINLFSLKGFSFAFGGTDPRYGYGLGFNAPAGQFIGQLKIDIFYVEGFLRGINADCSSGFHIGTNKININTLWYCTDGIYSNSGNLEFENNVVTVNYMTYCQRAVQSISSGTAHNVQNTYHIHCLELHTLTNQNGFVTTGANTNQNLYIVDAIYFNSNTQWIALGDGLSTRNEFRLPGADYAKLSAAGNVFKIDGMGNLNDVNPTRTIAYGPSPAPATGTWNVGDEYIVNNATQGGIASYRYTSTGWKAATVAGSNTYTPTRTLGTNAASSTTYTAFWTRNGDVVTVHGSLDIGVTAANTATEVRLTLPVASNLTGSIELAGTLGGIISNTLTMGYINGDATTDQAVIHISPAGTVSTNYSYSFSYRVL